MCNMTADCNTMCYAVVIMITLRQNVPLKSTSAPLGAGCQPLTYSASNLFNTTMKRVNEGP